MFISLKIIMYENNNQMRFWSSNKCFLKLHLEIENYA